MGVKTVGLWLDGGRMSDAGRAEGTVRIPDAEQPLFYPAYLRALHSVQSAAAEYSWKQMPRGRSVLVFRTMSVSSVHLRDSNSAATWRWVKAGLHRNRPKPNKSR